MSRIGKQPVQIPENVNVTISDHKIEVSGPKGKLQQHILNGFEVKQQDNFLIVKKIKQTPQTQKQYGLLRSLIANMVIGCSEGFKKELEVNGVGFRTQLKGKTLVLNLGFSHPLEYNPPEGIDLSVNQNIITISGYDKQLVGEVASQIRSFRKPEPYKGKGIKYIDEYIRRKAGKTAAKGESE